MERPRTFAIRTFGCQMNEHDSERLAGGLVAAGYVPGALSDADVVVLNTCTIRDNADQKLFGVLGQLKADKDARPGMQIAVAGCLAQRERGRIVERAPWVDVVVGTHNLMAAPGLLARAIAEGPLVEVLDGPDPTVARDAAPALYAVRESEFCAWVTIQSGCDNSCAFCIVP
ncbi:MAG TPA: tRNA (N6-isopentenyl adenosine(37)-C2)-methylthiotransferase MiaB, partial [Acidimicrobiales bacterium]|nr:tRNA (N6-isopentenyl adenosine(37)-C2)-methylthiotransferase MiaB [Acidimicrobiales bacterium]